MLRLADHWVWDSWPAGFEHLEVPQVHRDGGLCLLGFRDREHGVFHGEIVDPIPVTWTHRRLVERLA